MHAIHCTECSLAIGTLVRWLYSTRSTSRNRTGSQSVMAHSLAGRTTDLTGFTCVSPARLSMSRDFT